MTQIKWNPISWNCIQSLQLKWVKIYAQKNYWFNCQITDKTANKVKKNSLKLERRLLNRLFHVQFSEAIELSSEKQRITQTRSSTCQRKFTEESIHFSGDLSTLNIFFIYLFDLFVYPNRSLFHVAMLLRSTINCVCVNEKNFFSTMNFNETFVHLFSLFFLLFFRCLCCSLFLEILVFFTWKTVEILQGTFLLSFHDQLHVQLYVLLSFQTNISVSESPCSG